MTKENVINAIKDVLYEYVSVSEISDSGYVDYILESDYIEGRDWLTSSYDHKYELIDKIAQAIISKSEEYED